MLKMRHTVERFTQAIISASRGRCDFGFPDPCHLRPGACSLGRGRCRILPRTRHLLMEGVVSRNSE